MHGGGAGDMRLTSPSRLYAAMASRRPAVRAVLGHTGRSGSVQARPSGQSLQAWIHRLALQREHTEHTLVDTSEGLAADEAFEAFHTEGELP